MQFIKHNDAITGWRGPQNQGLLMLIKVDKIKKIRRANSQSCELVMLRVALIH